MDLETTLGGDASAAQPRPRGKRFGRAGRRRVFVSYRRSDTSGFAGRLYDELTERFGPGRVFRDIEAIPVASDFVHAIEHGVGSCAALVAVIGKEWASTTDGDGTRRLEDPADFVRKEIVAALDLGLTVVPVLVEDAPMPAAKDLPEPLRRLTRRNALEISDDRWDHDVGRLVAALEPALGRSRRRVLRTRPRRVAAVVVTALALVAAAISLTARPSPPAGFPPAAGPGPMTGDLRIAVAEFLELNPGGGASPAASALATSFSDELVRELEPFADTGFLISTRSPAETGRVEGTTREARAAAAAELARKHNANLLVYGVLDAGGSGTGLAPEFYLSEAALTDAEELAGDHELGRRVTTVGGLDNPVASLRLREQLLARTRAMAEFVIGLGYALQSDHAAALSHFQAAEASPGWDDGDGKEVLYLFIGNAAQKAKDLDRAESAYARAVAINPQYGRGRLGVAEVMFQRARGSCEAGGVDAAGLERAVAAFRASLDAKVKPAVADVPLKADLGISRALACQSQALLADRWAEAAAGFQRVITAFEAGTTRSRTLAAEAYGGMGLVHLPAAGAPDARAALLRSAEAYRKAVELSIHPDRTAAFSANLGFVYSKLGDRAAADAAYAAAINVEPDAARRAGYEVVRARAAGGEP